MTNARPCRVLHVVRPAAGGIRQHVISLISHTDRSRIFHTIAAPQTFLQSLPPLEGVEYIPLEIAARFAPQADLKAAWGLRRLMGRVDIVHAHGLRAGWIAALAACGTAFRFVMTAHNVSEDAGQIAKVGLRLIGRKASAIVTVSNAIADSLVHAGLPREKMHVIPNGIEIGHFERIGSQQQGFAVGCIARLSPEKGVDVLLKAAEMLPEITVFVAGDGPMRAVLTAHCPANVHLLGRIADTRTLLAMVQTLVVPSRSEGQGIAALEAMATGVPVIASRVGGLAEMLTDGVTALLVPPDDAPALAEAIRRMAVDTELRNLLRTHAGALVRERYEIRHMAERLTMLYREIMPR